MSADQDKIETSRRKGFEHSLQLLAGITSWQLWSSVLLIALLAVAIVLHASGLSLPVLGLLVLTCVMSGVTLRRQRRGLKLLREGLIEQTDSLIKQRVKADKFYEMATLDALTGLYNRRFGETRLQEEIAEAEKSGEPLVLLALDFDRFKEINDKHGHAAGDLALKEFSRRLQRAIRACDVPIRVGGDEFLVIFPECTLEKIPEIMSRMDSIAFTFAGHKIAVSFSQGAAQFQPNDTPETMIRRADERLYAQKAKRPGGGKRSSPSGESDAPRPQEEAQKPDSSAVRSIVANAGFRRSQRVAFEMPVEIYVCRENEEPTFEAAKTLSVNAHGALLALGTPVEIGQTARLANPRTQMEIECRVCRFAERHPSGMNEVAIAFATVAPTFWDVDSAPADWDPAWVPAPEREGAQVSFPTNAAPPVPLPGEGDSHVWLDTERVIDVSRPREWEPTWVPQPLLGRDAVGSLQNKEQEIIEEALHELHDPSENGRAKVKRERRSAHQWLISALVVSGALITLWVAMPRTSSDVAAIAGPKDDRGKGLPANEDARTTSQGPLESSASGMTSSNPHESTGFAAHACAPTEAAPTGSSTVMSRVMPRAAGFRMATKEDFDRVAVSRLWNESQEVSGEIAGDFTGSGESRAYLWVGNNKSWHVVIPAGAEMSCDLSFPAIAVAAPVSRESLKRIQWDGPAPTEPSGDGLLIVPSAQDRTSAVVLFLKGTEVVGSRPADYREIPLKK